MSSKPGQVGRFWLSKNRHGVWSLTWYDAASRHTMRRSLGTEDRDEAQMQLAAIAVHDDLAQRSDPGSRKKLAELEERFPWLPQTSYKATPPLDRLGRRELRPRRKRN